MLLLKLSVGLPYLVYQAAVQSIYDRKCKDATRGIKSVSLETILKE